MKEFVISEAKVETAVLVGLITQTQDERKTTEYLDELEFLAVPARDTRWIYQIPLREIQENDLINEEDLSFFKIKRNCGSIE